MSDQQKETGLSTVANALLQAIKARKCHKCACFQNAVEALDDSPLGTPLKALIARGRAAYEPQQYDCLGCKTCWPADALNDAGELVDLPPASGCPTDVVERQEGWPALPGDLRVIRFSAPIAVCTLHSRALVSSLAKLAPAGLSIVGSMQTENLGIERLIENVVANPNIRVLLICGEDTAGRVGHFPGQTLLSLIANGVDAKGKILGAAGRRPVLKNVALDMIAHFRRQVSVVDHRGETRVEVLVSSIDRAMDEAPGAFDAWESKTPTVAHIRAEPPGRLMLDPAGYIVITPDPKRKTLIVEHYANNGVLGRIIEGADPTHIMATLLAQKLVSRLDHAAYLGRELALAERAVTRGEPYRQDAAPEPKVLPSNGMSGGCSSNTCGENL